MNMNLEKAKEEFERNKIMPAPDYVHDTIRLASTFLDAGKDLEAGKLLDILAKVGNTGYRTAFNVLARDYGTGRIERAHKRAWEEEMLSCRRRR